MTVFVYGIVTKWYKRQVIMGATLLVFDANNNMMFVRTNGDSFLIHPGGKLREGEAPEDALRREVYEELGCTLKSVGVLGIVEGETIAGVPLRLYLFLGVLDGKPQPAGEVDAIYWLSRVEVTTAWAEHMTPITKDRILPLLALQGIW